MANEGNCMKYGYTAYYKTEGERIDAIAEDILREYPRLGALAKEAAKLEKTFGSESDDYSRFSDYENHINRLIDIVIVTEGKSEFQEEYEKACKDLLTNFENWSTNYTYANPEEQAAYLVVQRFREHNGNKEIPLITFGQAEAELREIKAEAGRKEKAAILRSKLPFLSYELAYEVIVQEEESGIQLRWVENDIIRLVTIVKLTEGRKEYEGVYSAAVAQLNNAYSNWMKTEMRGPLSSEQQVLVAMMERVNTHFQDGGSTPILTYAEMLAELTAQDDVSQVNVK